MQTTQEIYSNTILPLPPSERLRLAKLILEGLTDAAAKAPDYSDEWSDEDVRDLAAFSAQFVAEADRE